MVTLAAKNNFQELILAHLNTLTNPVVIAKINSCGKTLDGCQAFITGEMRKRQQGGCAVASDQEVYGMAVHFFEEDSITEKQAEVKAVAKFESKPKAVEKKEEPKKAAVVKDGQIEGQLSLF